MNKFIVTVALLLGNTAVNADWLLNGETTPPPIEDIKGEVGSDMKFGFVKGIFSLPTKIIGDDKVTKRIEDSEEGRNTKAVTAGELGAGIAVSTGVAVASGALTTGSLAAQVANLTTKAEKTDKYLEYQNTAIKAQDNAIKTLEETQKVMKETQKYQDNAIKAQDNAIKTLEETQKVMKETQKYQDNAIKALESNLDTVASKVWANP